jgi:hypothetical protein
MARGSTIGPIGQLTLRVRLGVFPVNLYWAAAPRNGETTARGFCLDLIDRLSIPHEAERLPTPKPGGPATRFGYAACIRFDDSGVAEMGLRWIDRDPDALLQATFADQVLRGLSAGSRNHNAPGIARQQPQKRGGPG